MKIKTVDSRTHTRNPNRTECRELRAAFAWCTSLYLPCSTIFPSRRLEKRKKTSILEKVEETVLQRRVPCGCGGWATMEASARSRRLALPAAGLLDFYLYALPRSVSSKFVCSILHRLLLVRFFRGGCTLLISCHAFAVGMVSNGGHILYHHSVFFGL